MSNIHLKYGISDFMYPNEEAIKNPNDIRHISIKNNSVSVVKAEKTEMELSLDNFYTLVDSTEERQIELNSYDDTKNLTPYFVDKIYLPDDTTFLAMLCEYKNDENNLIDWCYANSIDNEIYKHDIPQDINIFHYINIIKGGYKNPLHYDEPIGHLWMGTSFGLLKWDGISMKLLNKYNSDLNIFNIIDIDVDTNDDVWMITNDQNFENIITYYNTSSNTFKQFTIDKNQLISSQIIKIKIFSTNTLLAITSNDFIILDYKNNTYKIINKRMGYNFLYLPLLDICYDNNMIYLCDNEVIYSYNMSTDIMSRINLNIFYDDSILTIKALDDKLYIGTHKFFIIYDIADNTFEKYNILNSNMFENVVNKIEILHNDNIAKLYLLHESHITIYDISNNEFIQILNSVNTDENEISNIYPVMIDNDEILYYYGIHALQIDNNLSYKYSLFKIKMIDSSQKEFVPEDNKYNEIIFIYPNNHDHLYSIDQPIYLMFSKLTKINDIIDNINIMHKKIYIRDKNIEEYNYSDNCNVEQWNEILGMSNTDYFYAYKLTFNKSFLPSSDYNIFINKDILAFDNSELIDDYSIDFSTQNIAPVDDWSSIEKLMILNSNEKNYLKNIYIRNINRDNVLIHCLFGKKII